MRKFQEQYIWLFILLYMPYISAVKPVFDYSNNMRLVLLPADTKLNSVIYRLRASDADEHYPLQFTAYDAGNGEVSKIVSITHIDCSTMAICEADVILINSLEDNKLYELNLEVKDTSGETTVVKSVIQATTPTGPFIGAPRIIRVPETTQPHELIESFFIRENLQVYRGVHCHLEPPEARMYFELHPGFKTNVREISRCDLKLKKKLDYEARSAFILQIIAENAWVDNNADTRNVGVHEVVIEVEDEADTPPYFLIAPPVTKLAETAGIGTSVLQVTAYDGDYAHPRRLRYGLDPTDLPFSSYFDIEPDQGIVKVRKSLQEIDVQPSSPVLLRIFVEELNENGLATGDKSEVDVAVVIDDVINHPPQFLQKNYIASIEENSAEGTTLSFVGGFDRVQDFDKGENGKLELAIVGFADTFEISPSIVNQDAQFVINVKNNKRLDFEQVRQMNFKIVAQELGVNKLSTSADVSVNILDTNDNKPQFTQNAYEFDVAENEESGTVVGKVNAFDEDSQENGEITYRKIVSGNSPLVNSFDVEATNGNILLTDNSYLDREQVQRFVMTIVAQDLGTPSQTSQTTLVINVIDVNDNPPIFKKRKYQGFMNKDLTGLRNDLQVEAFDKDQLGTKNSQIRYEIIQGNYEKKFFIDSLTGQISVLEPLQPDLIRRNSRDVNSLTNSSTIFQRISTQPNIEPVISLTVRAYDLGVPSLDSEVLVHIFTEQTSSRTMRFIVYEDPDILNEKQDEFSDLISAMTGGQAEIQDIQPYDDETSIDRSDLYEIEYMDDNRNSKDYNPEHRTKRSLVEVRIEYPPNSLVDMSDIEARLKGSETTTNSPFSTALTTIKPKVIEELQYKNAALFWGLISILALIVIFILILACCFCCPGCYLYKKDKTQPSQMGSSDDIRVLTVKNESGQELKDAKFVEVLRSAGRHIRTASARARRKLEKSNQQLNQKIKGAQVKVYEPTYRDPNNIIFIRDELESGNDNSAGQIFVRALEEHEPGKVRQKDVPFPDQPLNQKVFEIVNEKERRVQSIDAKDDIQIMKLDDETRMAETYYNYGNAEVLKIEDNPVAEAIASAQPPPTVLQDANTSPTKRPESPPQRSLSELELFKQKHNLPEEGEFYTAIGPDGKEIILRRYLNEQSEHPDLSGSLNHHPGFLNVAINHLKNNQRPRNHRKRQKLTTASLDGDASPRESTSEDEGVFSLKPHKPSSTISAPEVLMHEQDLTPKHYIRTPILEETESNMEAELLSRQMSREHDRFRYWNNPDPDVSLRFKIQDGGRHSPEPAYTETKASILRRRNTLAKMMQQEERILGRSYDLSNRFMAKNRHWSLTDLPRSQIEEESRLNYIKRWNSLSNDEMMRIREDRFIFEPGMVTFQKYSNNRVSGNSMLPKSNMVQMANITVMPKSEKSAENPRKFSKYNPITGRRKRARNNNTNEELIYIRQNYPVPSNSTIWNRHGAGPVSMGNHHRNIEIQHISTTPSIAHSNSFGDSKTPHQEYVASNTSSEVPSRTSSVSNLRPSEVQNPYLTQDDKTSPKKHSQVTPRYMNWYKDKRSKSRVSQLPLDAKTLAQRSQNALIDSNEDTESGISSMSMNAGRNSSKNNSLLMTQKKSVFTIAYDDMATKEIQPLSSESN